MCLLTVCVPLHTAHFEPMNVCVHNCMPAYFGLLVCYLYIERDIEARSVLTHSKLFECIAMNLLTCTFAQNSNFIQNQIFIKSQGIFLKLSGKCPSATSWHNCGMLMTAISTSLQSLTFNIVLYFPVAVGNILIHFEVFTVVFISLKCRVHIQWSLNIYYISSLTLYGHSWMKSGAVPFIRVIIMMSAGVGSIWR